jgi:hypothetical protein
MIHDSGFAIQVVGSVSVNCVRILLRIIPHDIATFSESALPYLGMVSV